MVRIMDETLQKKLTSNKKWFMSLYWDDEAKSALPV